MVRALGTYYQYNLDNEELKSFNPGNGGFYRAGAVVDGDYVYFGGDGGYLYARPVGDDFDNTSEGSVINLSTIGGVDSGNVRSTISLVDGHLYFTSQGGYLWSFTPGAGTPTLDWKVQLAGTSTSTPTVVGDNIYVGYYSGFTAGGVQKVAKTGNHEVSYVATPGPVQSSILVYTKGGVDYLYFTTNSGTGAGYCFNGSNGARVWQTPGDTYALQGMAYSGGVLTFGNDNDSFYVIGERYVPPTPPETSLPNNTGQLLWPADSSEVTLCFGQIDEQYTAVNKGMNIQGTANSNVYSVCDGVVAYKGYSSTYGNLLYVDFKYNDVTMQVRYGHLSESSKLKVGDVVKQGDVVGEMGRDANTGKGLIEIVFCESKDGMPCNKNGKNIQLVDPIQYLERPRCDISYLEKDMTTMLDTAGLGETPVLPSIIWPWEDKNDPDIRYRENKDVNIKQAYLRKLIVEYGREIDKTITHKNIEKKGIITYDAKNGITTVKLNGRSKRYGVSLGNAQIKNNRMVVNREQVWYDLIGKTYNSPEGGTWYADKPNRISGGVWQSVYLPKEIAKDLYLVTERGPVENLLYDKAVGVYTVGSTAITTEFSKYLLSEYGITLAAGTEGLFAGAVVFGYELSKAWGRGCFKDAVMKCGDNEFVKITYFITDGGIVNIYGVTNEIKDVYRSQGTFKSGHYEGYAKVK